MPADPPPAPAQDPPDPPTAACKNPACGRAFAPRRHRDGTPIQECCSADCRRASWRLRHPTFEQLAAMGEEDLRAALRRLMEARSPGLYGRLRVRWGDPAAAPKDRSI